MDNGPDKKTYKFLFFPVLLILAFSCSSYDTFLLKTMSNSEKSDILTEKGIAKFREEIEKAGNYSSEKKEEVEKYFRTALAFNRANNTAKEYIRKLSSLKELLFERMYDNAMSYKDIRNKNESDEFNMCFYLEKALAIDPSNKKAQKFKKEIKDVYDKLIKLYASRGGDIKSRINSTRDKNRREKLYIAGNDNYYRATLIDPSNSTFKNELKFYESRIADTVKSKLAELNAGLKKGRFESVADSMYILDQNNRRIYNRFTKEILDLKFRLYYYWGIVLYRDKKYQAAIYKINAALSIKNDNYLAGLKDKINDTLSSEYFKNSFDSIIIDIDEMINNGDLDLAKKKIDYYRKSIRDPGQKRELEKRSKLILDKIPGLYQSAVNDYNDENFDDAMKKFGIVSRINPDYLDLKNYIEKTKNKQQMLQNY